MMIAAGSGLGLILAVIALATVLTGRRRLDTDAEGASTAERAEALRSVQQQIDRGRRPL